VLRTDLCQVASKEQKLDWAFSPAGCDARCSNSRSIRSGRTRVSFKDLNVKNMPGQDLRASPRGRGRLNTPLVATIARIAAEGRGRGVFTQRRRPRASLFNHRQVAFYTDQRATLVGDLRSGRLRTRPCRKARHDRARWCLGYCAPIESVRSLAAGPHSLYLGPRFRRCARAASSGVAGATARGAVG